MTSTPAGPASTPASSPRLGRALFYVHQQTQVITDPVIKAKLGQLIAAGQAMGFAVTLKDQRLLTGAMAIGVAREARSRCVSIVRPAPAAASRAVSICSLVRGRLDSTSQPLEDCFQPWRRRPLRVTNEEGTLLVSDPPAPRTCRLSIL